MTTTYYLLRSKNSAVGDGLYLGTDAEGKPAVVTTHQEARRFADLVSAEKSHEEFADQFGGFEIEVRTTEAR